VSVVETHRASSRPLSQYVLKIHSRCDLACDHCYIYEHADQSWRGRPRVIAADTVSAAASRIAEHAASHRLPLVHVVLHGGEPLLMEYAGLRATLHSLRSAIEPVTALDLRLQTNGVRLTAELCDLFVDNDVHVGVSLDGYREANDRHRRFRDGASSYDKVCRALALLRRPEYRGIYAGILCTIDIHNDPIRVYEELLQHEPPRVDLLLPHATWDQPPRRPDSDPSPYATWLLRIYERWIADGRPVPIRLFDSLLSLGAGGPSGTETVGLDPADLVVIEADGTWEQADSTKTAFHGAPVTGLDVFHHSVDEVVSHPSIARRQTGLADLCPTCRACPVVTQCGGGLFAHRYRTDGGYDNPSVYCADLKELILSINGRRRRPAPGPRSGAVPLEVLDQIGSGSGDAASVEYLAEAELAITRALIVAVAGEAGSSTMVAESLSLLGSLDRTAPAAVRSVLTHPYIRPWAVRCLRGSPDADYLSCIGAAAAALAGAEVQTPVAVRDGRVHLPTLGTVTLPSPAAPCAVLSAGSDRFAVHAAGVVVRVPPGFAPSPGWRPTWRAVTGGPTLLIEDADPYRDCFERPLAEAFADVATLHDAIAGAWREVLRDAPDQVPGLTVGLRAVTPLAVDPGGLLRSATARDAFGAVGLVPADEDALAVMLVHEFQHSKLGAVLDLCDLFDPDYRVRLPVGWRPDPRPIEGVLQGTYAHVAVADIWRVRSERPGDRTEARSHFLRYREWLDAALDALAGTGALTAAGARLVDRMRATVDYWTVPPSSH
jgi:uncharacterized protein